jgi:hypothetical protein
MGVRKATDEQLRILRFWWMLELFSPQTVPKLTPRVPSPSSERVISWVPDDPLPWTTLAPPKPMNGTRMVWRHTVYLGVYALEDVYESLHRVFGDDADAYDERPAGLSACAGILVDEGGRLVADSPELSSTLWAVGRTYDPGPQDPHWSEGFELALKAFTDEVDKRERARQESVWATTPTETHDNEDDADYPPPPLDGPALHDLLRLAHACAGIRGQGNLASERIVIRSTPISANRSGDANDTDFLNSFFLDDLRTVRENLAAEGLGDALSSYLTGDDALQSHLRTDVVSAPQEVQAGVSLDRLPKGRWPSDPRHSLALSQQFAVNHALQEIAAENGLMGVNGPPGTGKTTMLRDILAGNVVERARRLAALPEAADAFTETVHTWNTGGKNPAKVPQLRPELTGFEMIVASANNAAVENVTVEIPGEEAIAERWREDADYFKDIATRVLRSSPRQGDEAPTAWGIVAAKLGKKANRSQFRNAFWFDEQDPRTRKPLKDGVRGMENTLRRRLQNRDEQPTWTQARHTFLQAEQKVDRLLALRREAQARLDRLPVIQGRAGLLEDDVRQRQRRLAQAEHELSLHLPQEDKARDRWEHALADHERQLRMKPGILETLFSFGRAIRSWRAQMEALTGALTSAQHHVQEAAAHTDRLQAAQQGCAAKLAEVEAGLNRVREELDELTAQCAKDEKLYGDAYPDWQRSGERSELRAPWLDEDLDTARSELFLAALQLHQDFLVAGGYTVLDGLRAAVEVVGGKHPATLEPEKLHAAWQLFFLAVPLVSTTFASASRMFGKLGSEALGWLFIDEAGQACPQYAVGSIWRARRVVAVGDPLQLQPVVTIPHKAQSDIAAAYGVSRTWMPPRASVQTLADRVARQGTTLHHDDEAVWVSAPLRVHRRCDEPMFSICNEIAYNGIMVNGVTRSPGESKPSDLFDTLDGPRIAPSHWAHEPAVQSGTHLQPSQIERFTKALAYLAERGVGPAEVIAVSPFKVVADRLASLRASYPGLRAGTIHTAQGQEAPVVVLVLGGDPDSPGAKAWAASSVNLVNVAVSRAQRRLYVIGDREAWSQHNYFRQLSLALH